MIANGKCNLPFGLWQAVSNGYMLLAPPAAKLNSVIPLESGHLRPTTFLPCEYNGMVPTTRKERTHVCRSNQTLCLMT